MLKQITIRGRNYTLRSEDGAELEMVAAEVDRRMRDLAVRAPSMDEYTVSLLTAINLASELRTVRRETDALLTGLEQRAGGLEELVEGMLGGLETGEGV